MSTRKNVIFRIFPQGVAAMRLSECFPEDPAGVWFQGRGLGAGWATSGLEFLRFVFGLFFRGPLLSAKCSGLFLGSFFPQLPIFNNFPALFSGSFLAIDVVFRCI